MAKTSVSKSSAQRRMAHVRKERQWVKAELEALPQELGQRREKKLSKIAEGLNRKLAKAAFDACDKAEYAEYEIGEKLQKYDVKQYMAYRAANHGFAKRAFAAVKAGRGFEAELAAHEEAVKKLRGKRAAYKATLEAKKQAFVSRYGKANDAAYVSAKAQLAGEYESAAKRLEAESETKLKERSAALSAKLKGCDERMGRLAAAAKVAAELPEEVLLRVEGLKMYFGGLKAVDDLTFDVKKGEIFGLIGPNGAGKTTVFNCITRFYDATGGSMYFVNKHGETVDLRAFKVHEVIQQGITRTFQNVELVKEISVLENLLVACTQDYRSGLVVQALGLPTLHREERILRAKAQQVLEFMGIESYAAWPASGLPYGVLKKVEIARALMTDARLIIMDEPAAGLNDTETAELTRIIRRIRDEFGVTILLVEHDMGLVMTVCDTVCAISFGKMLAIGSRDEIRSDKAVQEAYLGVEEDE